MRIFDLHADIGYDIYHRHQAEQQDVLKYHHLPKLIQGEVMGVGMVSFFEGHEDLKQAKSMVSFLRDEIARNADVCEPYLKGELHPSKINACMTVEGMCFIHRKPEETLQWLYDQGVRIASLTWNDENALATGVKGNPSRGLTTLGQRAIRKMNELHMVIDVSHTNEKSFWDILAQSKKPVIATHSNSRILANVERNLTDQQARALMAQGGLIGLVAARKFVASDEALQNARTLANHALHYKALGSVEHIAIGFDYMDFLEGDYGRKAMTPDLEDATMSQNLVRALLELGFSEEEVEKICWKNSAQFLKAQL